MQKNELHPLMQTSLTMYVHLVYTQNMEYQPRRIIWDRHNLKHLFQDHPEREITKEEVEEVLRSPHSFVVPPHQDAILRSRLARQ